MGQCSYPETNFDCDGNEYVCADPDNGLQIQMVTIAQNILLIQVGVPTVLSMMMMTSLPLEMCCICGGGTSYMIVYGCTEPYAINYDAITVDDDSCVYSENGCTDETALNYSPGATIDDGFIAEL